MGEAAATTFDAIVVGAGPAGSCAATVLARAGHRVLLLERGPFPGAKNMYGGVVYPRILDTCTPAGGSRRRSNDGSRDARPWCSRRRRPSRSTSRAARWGEPPYNGATALRPEFDAWLAERAQADGATLLCATTATGLLRDRAGRVIGVRTDRPDGDVSAPVVIACDGVNSFLAKEAGLYTNADAAHYTVGVKQTLALPRTTIEERFGVRGHDGVDIEIVRRHR